jgi:AmiR/NasT family two-component response regulator
MTTSDGHSVAVAHASGMISEQAECSLEDALVRMQERAQSTGRTVEEIAKAVVEGRLQFTPLSD